MAKEINLKDFLKVMKARLWLIIVMTVLATLAGYLYSTFFKPTPLFASSTRLVVGATKDTDMSTLKVLMKDSTVLEKVSKELQYTRSPGMLATEITAGDIDSSQVVSISVIDPDPRMAAQIANLTASTFKSEAANILNYRNIRLLAEAKENPTPINPSNNHKIIYSAIFGLVVGIGLAFFLNSLDDSMRSEKELEKILEAPVLGSVSKMKKKNMMARQKSNDMRKNTVELTNMLQIETTKGKRAYKRKNESGREDASYIDTHSI
jgi:capsular polysaccharide biosynthesis protein